MKAPLEQYRLSEAADLAEQNEVLHAARSDLDHVRDARDRFEVHRVHDFGHDGKPALATRLVEQIERDLAQSLKRVRRRARLVRAAAQHARAGVAHAMCGLEKHRASFD